MSKPLDHLIVARARKIIEDPKHWTRRELTTFNNGRRAKPHHKRASRFCAIGALVRAALELTGDPDEADRLFQDVRTKLQRLAGLPHYASLTNLDDGYQGHAIILNLFDNYLAGHKVQAPDTPGFSPWTYRCSRLRRQRIRRTSSDRL